MFTQFFYFDSSLSSCYSNSFLLQVVPSWVTALPVTVVTTALHPDSAIPQVNVAPATTARATRTSQWPTRPTVSVLPVTTALKGRPSLSAAPREPASRTKARIHVQTAQPDTTARVLSYRTPWTVQLTTTAHQVGTGTLGKSLYGFE